MHTPKFVLIAAIITATFPANGATQNKCDNPIYNKTHPEECAKPSKTWIGTALVLGGAATAAGVAMAAGMSGGGGGGGGGDTMPTMNTYNYVGGDVTEAKLSAVMATDAYIKNQSQYDTIRLAYSLARGYTGKNSNIAVLDSASWHGKAVAAIAAGPIAPDAVVTHYQIADRGNKFITYGEIGDVIATAAATSDIINASWNTEMRANAVHSREQVAHLTDVNFIDNMAAAARRGTIFVWAAGNEGAAQPGALSALPRVVPEMRGHFINVVAWDDARGALAEYSNACGATMEYCITAPGSGIDAGGRVVSGTSFAAPVVSAAVAVLREAFPYMTPEQITDLLFTTARDLGAPGVDAVYGHGMLDLERASRPVGTQLVPLAAGGAAPLRAAHVPAAIGRKLQHSDIKLAFVDDYGRTFEAYLRDQIKIKNHGRGFEALRGPRKLSANAGPVEFGFRRSEFLSAAGLLGTDENNTITFIAINGEFDAGRNTKIFLRPEIGTAHPRGRTDSMVTKFSGIYTAGISTGLRRGNWAASVAIPDMILAGDMHMRMPRSRTADGTLMFNDYKTSLSGGGAIEYSLSYRDVTAAFVDNTAGTDEFYIMAKRKIAF